MQNNAGFTDLKVYQASYQFAMEIFKITKNFPKEEKYSLIDQIRRSSRSVCSNIAEGYRKKIYPKSYLSKLVDADGECSETIVWLNFAKDCSYLAKTDYDDLLAKYKCIGAMLGKLIKSIKSSIT